MLLAAVFAPSSITVRRSVKINAPQKVVFSQVANFENWKKWDAWYAMDTAQKRTYFGTLNDKKQGYSWSSENPDVGNGRMEMTEIVGMDKLAYTFYFDDRPTNGAFLLNTEGEKTEVVWEMYSELGYPFKLMNYFIDPLVGPDFEKGLANLKTVAEAMPKENISDGSVQVVNELGVNYALLKAVDLPMEDVEKFLSDSYTEIYGYTSTNGLTPQGPPRGLYYEWNEEKGTATLAAAVPISGFSGSQEKSLQLGIGVSVVTNNYVACEYTGGASTNYRAHSALASWADTNDKRILEPVVEEYKKGWMETADTLQYQTKIYYYYE